MTVHPESPAKVAFYTWWPVALAVAVGVLIHPLLAIVFALALAVIRRYDRPVMLTLIGVAVAWLLFATLFMGVTGGGVGSSG
jgi:hypothetical protein